MGGGRKGRLGVEGGAGVVALCEVWVGCVMFYRSGMGAVVAVLRVLMAVMRWR